MSAIDAAARIIYQTTEDQPWEAASLEEEETMRDIAALVFAVLLRTEHVEAAANAISESSGMRFDGFWSRIEDLEPEDRDHALKEARDALEAAMKTGKEAA